LPIAAVTLQECEAPSASAPSSFRAVWRCSRCRRSSVTVVEPNDVQRLARAGVRQVRWRPPRELTEARPVAEPLTHDDLLDWHERLAAPGLLEAEVAKLRA